MSPLSPDDLRSQYQALPPQLQERMADYLKQLRPLKGPPAQPTAPVKRAALTHRAIGRLVFKSPAANMPTKPLHHMTVELWDRDFGPDDCLGRGMTDRDGRFEIRYDPADAGWKDEPDLQLRVFDFDHHYKSSGAVQTHPRMIFLHDGPDDVISKDYNFGEVQVPFWNYDPDAMTPRVHVVENGSPPQAFSIGRSVMLVAQNADIEFHKRKHFLENRLNRSRPSLDQIQRDYPESRTLELERQRPGWTRSDEYFGERILNGMSASVLDRDPLNPDRLWLHHHWNSYEQDGVHAMPNVDVWFELRGEHVVPVEIALQFRQRGKKQANAPPELPQHLTPADGERWKQAKRVARVSAALYAELDVHLVQTHLNTEQYAIAAYRNFRRSPLRYLLAPHLKEVILINREADYRLLGERGYITRATAFTAKSLQERVRQSLGTLDWKNWRPREILCETHQYAQAAHLFWDVLTEYVDWFFERNDADIREHWFEVHQFSDDLVQHSVPFFMCQFLRNQLAANRGNGGPPLGAWYEPNERIDLTVDRVDVNGQKVAIQPITHSDDCDEQGLENLKEVCRYVIHHATFMHTWSNSRQYDDGGELVYNGLGLRYGDKGVLSPESDHRIAPRPDQASEQLWFGWLLSHSGYGYIMRNEDRDIHPQLVCMLREKKEQFAAIGVDIDTIQSRTNI